MSSEEVIVDDTGVSEEDRLEILAEIDKIVEETRNVGTTEDEPVRIKRGASLPVAINILAIAVVVGAFFGASYLADLRDDDLTLRSQEIATPEGRLIAEIRREAEARLEKKDAEIERIQGELTDLDAERAELQSEIEDELSRRQAELDQVLEQQVALERSRLEALGQSETDIADRLASLRVTVEEEQAAELANFRNEAGAALAAKEAELEETRRLTEQILEEARLERSQLSEEQALREEELVERYEAEAARLADRTSAAEDELQTISNAREQETLITDQIIGTYALVEERIAAGEYRVAKQDLDNLERILLDPALQQVPIIAQRRSTELFVIDSLGTYLEMQAAAGEQQATDSILDAANSLSSARGIIARADELYSAGDSDSAISRYREALRLLPNVNLAVSKIEEIERARLDALITEGLVAAGEYLAAGDIESALEAYQGAALSGDVTSISRQATVALSTTGAEIRSNESEAYEATIDSLRTDLQSVRTELTASAANLRSTRSTLRASESRVSELERDVLLLEQTTASLTTDLGVARGETARRGDEIVSLEDTIVEKEDLIDSLSGSLEAEAEKINSLQAEIIEQNGRVAELVESLASNEGRVATLQSRLETANEALSASSNELDSAKLTLEDMRSELDSTKIALAEIEAEAMADREALLQAIAEAEAIAKAAEGDAAAAAAEIAAAEAAIVAADSAAQTLADAKANVEAEAALAAELADAKISLLEESLEESAEQEAVLQGQIGALLGQISDASNRLDENATEIVDLIGEIENLEERVDTLGAENVLVSTRANELLGSVNELETMLAEALIPPDSVLEERELVDQFEAFKVKSDELLGGSAINRFELASAEFASFLSDAGDQAFPGIAQLRSRILVGLIAALDATAFEAGGRTALNEVLRYVNFLGAGDAGSLASRLAFESLAEKDLLYRRVFAKLDELSGVEDLSDNVLTLVGSVTGFIDGIVEFDLDQGLVPNLDGSVILRRIDSDGNENPVAQGVVESIDENSSRGRADIRLYLDPIPPIDGDLVYAEFLAE